VTNWLQRFGRSWLDILERLGRAHLFLLQMLTAVLSLPARFGLVIRQLYAAGVMTLLIILVSGLFVGMVLGLQGYNVLVGFGAEESLGIFVSLTLVRELGPVVCFLQGEPVLR